MYTYMRNWVSLATNAPCFERKVSLSYPTEVDGGFRAINKAITL